MYLKIHHGRSQEDMRSGRQHTPRHGAFVCLAKLFQEFTRRALPLLQRDTTHRNLTLRHNHSARTCTEQPSRMHTKFGGQFVAAQTSLAMPPRLGLFLHSVHKITDISTARMNIMADLLRGSWRRRRRGRLLFWPVLSHCEPLMLD